MEHVKKIKDKENFQKLVTEGVVSYLAHRSKLEQLFEKWYRKNDRKEAIYRYSHCMKKFQSRSFSCSALPLFWLNSTKNRHEKKGKDKREKIRPENTLYFPKRLSWKILHEWPESKYDKSSFLCVKQQIAGLQT